MTGGYQGTLPVYQFASSLISPSDRFIDLGCGTGRGMKYLVASRLQGVGVDYSEKGKELASNLNIICHDLEKSLPFDDETFDLALCVMVLYCLNDPLALIHETWRVLKSGGNLLVANPGTHTYKEEFYYTPTKRELYDLIKTIFPDCIVFDHKAWKMALATK